jgi:multiple sugar transport system ATP-binding protein
VQLRAEIKEMHQRIGATFIYVTHDQAEAMTLSDRVAVMLEGELLQVAPPSKIYSDPADRRVAEFIGSPKINILAAKVRDRATVDVAGSVLSLATGLVAGKELSIGIRPEALTPSETGGANALTGRVRFVEHLGSDLFVHLDVPGSEEPVIARLLADRSASVETGQTMHLNARPDGILLFDADGRRLEAGQGAKVAALRSIA